MNITEKNQSDTSIMNIKLYSLRDIFRTHIIYFLNFFLNITYFSLFIDCVRFGFQGKCKHGFKKKYKNVLNDVATFLNFKCF